MDAAFGSSEFAPLRRCPPSAGQRLLRHPEKAIGASRSSAPSRLRGSDNEVQQWRVRALEALIESPAGWRRSPLADVPCLSLRHFIVQLRKYGREAMNV